MVRLEYKNLVILGVIPSELEHLKQGQPLEIKLESNLVVVIIPGDSNEMLHEVAKKAAARLEDMSKKNGGKLVVPKGLFGKPH